MLKKAITLILLSLTTIAYADPTTIDCRIQGSKHTGDSAFVTEADGIITVDTRYWSSRWRSGNYSIDLLPVSEHIDTTWKKASKYAPPDHYLLDVESIVFYLRTDNEADTHSGKRSCAIEPGSRQTAYAAPHFSRQKNGSKKGAKT
jgi:hypothetical protein